MQRTMLTRNHIDRDNRILSKESCQKTSLGLIHFEVQSGEKNGQSCLACCLHALRVRLYGQGNSVLDAASLSQGKRKLGI